MGAHFAGWPVAGPIRPVPGVGCRGVCVGGGDMVFILDLHVPFCLALLYFYLLWLLKLSLLYLTPVAQYDSVAMLISIMSGPIREPWKNIIIFFTIRLDSVDSIFGYRFDFDFIGYSVFFSDQSVPVQIRFRFQRFRLRLSLLCVRVISQMCFKRQHRHFRNAEKILIGHWRCIPDAYLTCNDNVFFWLSIKNTGKLPNLDFWSSSTDWTYH